MTTSQDPSACPNCNGKGYNTRCYDEVGSNDFGGEGYAKRGQIEKVPCKKCQDPSASSAETLEKVRKILVYFKRWKNQVSVGDSECIRTREYMEREMRNEFEEIASLFLEQAEEIRRLREVVDEAAESLNHVRNIAYSSDDHRIMNIAEDGLKNLRPFLPSL